MKATLDEKNGAVERTGVPEPPALHVHVGQRPEHRWSGAPTPHLVKERSSAMGGLRLLTADTLSLWDG